MKELKINHLAAWAAIIVILAVLYVWYNVIFYDSWLSINKLSAEYVAENKSMVPYIISFITTVLIVYILAWTFAQLKIDGAPDGIGVALVFGFAFTFLNILAQDQYAFRPIEISFVDGGANLIACLIAGGILGGWRKIGPKNSEV